MDNTQAREFITEMAELYPHHAESLKDVLPHLRQPASAPAAVAEEGGSLPCPFCGSTDISDGEVLGEHASGQKYSQSMCRSCGALGPEGNLAQEQIDYGDLQAIAAWNRRPATPSASAALPTASDPLIDWMLGQPASEIKLPGAAPTAQAGADNPIKLAPSELKPGLLLDEQGRYYQPVVWKPAYALTAQAGELPPQVANDLACLIEYCKAEIAANEKQQTTTAWTNTHTPQRILAALLATSTPTGAAIAGSADAKDAELERRLKIAREAATYKAWADLFGRFTDKQRQHVANLLSHKWTISAVEMQSRYHKPGQESNRVDAAIAASAAKGEQHAD